MNKLLKVLEDRRVMLESAYYSADDPAIPRYIHDIFKNGFPADFRLVGATTRSPEEIPPAIRSRCMEVYFRPLSPKEVGGIGVRAANRAGFLMEQAAIERIASYAESGRDAVNVVQVAAGVCQMEGRRTISVEDVDWVLRSGRYAPRHEYSLSGEHRVGVVNGLGVLSTGVGSVMEIEAVALPAAPGTGTIKATGIVEEEETGNMAHRARRRSMAASSMENVRTALLQLGVPLGEYHVHINYPGGIPVDGPSAGLAMGVAVFSAVSGRAVRGDVAMTGEMTARGEVRAVGGVPVKAAAAAHAGAQVVLIPQENLQTGLCAAGARIVAVSTLSEALPIALCDADAARPIPAAASAPAASPPLAPALAAHTAQPAHPPA